MPTGRPSTASPLKSPKKRHTVTAGHDYEQMINDQQHNMQMIISEKEIELERLKTTVFSLNGKCSIVDDHVEDVNNANARFNNSEEERGKTQVHIIETSKKVVIDDRSHTDYQNQLVEEINSLKAQIESDKQAHFRALQQKDQYCEEVRTALNLEMNQVRTTLTA
jgi:chromosome segregation ATPase